VPSLRQSSLPWTPSSAPKKSTPSDSAMLLVRKPLHDPGQMSRTVRVPAAVPSVARSSIPSVWVGNRSRAHSHGTNQGTASDGR
jgi:hypothetical protein